MEKKFNITGLCVPGRHFMADMSKKMEQVKTMISRGDYFSINKPHQYGKTTMLQLLELSLQEDKRFLVLNLSFEGIAASTYEHPQRFIQVVLGKILRDLKFMKEDQLARLIEQKISLVNGIEGLDFLITDLIAESKRDVAVMIDEVDKAGNHWLFLDFLGMLREKYLRRNQGKDYTFHSVILAGVHDVKSFKAKIRPDEQKTFNSPWNIAVDFNIDLGLFPGEIASMLENYADERQVKIDIPYFVEKLLYFTSGYPFLVSLLCNIIDEELLPGKTQREWQPQYLTEAVHIALKKNCTNFNTLFKNLESNHQLYELVFKIIMNEREFSYNLHNPIIHAGTIHGILKEEKGKTRIHNRLYEQRIYNYMSSKIETSSQVDFDHTGSRCLTNEGYLDIEKVILKFQEFMKEQYSRKDREFIERNGKLLFLAFIKPIINGRGFDFKEVQLSDEKRLDIAITFENRKYIIELKIWRGESYHQTGLNQLIDYLERQSLDTGFLLIYDLRKQSGRVGESQWITAGGKKIFAAWV